MKHIRRAAVHRRAHPSRARPAQRNSLVPQADSQDRQFARQSCRTTSSEQPASSGVHGPGDNTTAAGAMRFWMPETSIASLRTTHVAWPRPWNQRRLCTKLS